METLRDGREVKVVTDQHITPTMNTNLAQMLLEVAERKLPGVYHLAGSTRISRYSFAVELARTFGFDEKLIIPARMEELRWKAKRPGDSSLDTSKAVRDLKARPWSLGEALKALKAEVE
jgi:dTDP-4-dehydrorhamnose reductase